MKEQTVTAPAAARIASTLVNGVLALCWLAAWAVLLGMVVEPRIKAALPELLTRYFAASILFLSLPLILLQQGVDVVLQRVCRGTPGVHCYTIVAWAFILLAGALVLMGGTAFVTDALVRRVPGGDLIGGHPFAWIAYGVAAGAIASTYLLGARWSAVFYGPAPTPDSQRDESVSERSEPVVEVVKASELRQRDPGRMDAENRARQIVMTRARAAAAALNERSRVRSGEGPAAGRDGVNEDQLQPLAEAAQLLMTEALERGDPDQALRHLELSLRVQAAPAVHALRELPGAEGARAVEQLARALEESLRESAESWGASEVPSLDRDALRVGRYELDDR